jgi:hypothetical protein
LVAPPIITTHHHHPSSPPIITTHHHHLSSPPIMMRSSFAPRLRKANEFLETAYIPPSNGDCERSFLLTVNFG